MKDTRETIESLVYEIEYLKGELVLNKININEYMKEKKVLIDNCINKLEQ